MLALLNRIKNKVLVVGGPKSYLYRWMLILSHPLEFFQRWRQTQLIKPYAQEHASKHLNDLEACGYSVATPLLDRPLVQELTQEVERRMQVDLPKTEADGGKNFWSRLLKDDELVDSSVFVRVATQPKVLNTVTAYLGSVPMLDYVEIMVSYHVPGQEWKHSQLWHRDYSDARCLKLFIYLSDCVSSDSGPFGYIPLKESQRLSRLFPIRYTDEEVIAAVGKDAMKSAELPKGGGFLVDSSRLYHMGSRVAEGHLRIAFAAHYTTKFPLFKAKPIADLQPRVATGRVHWMPSLTH